jgi:hypothetical protein
MHTAQRQSAVIQQSIVFKRIPRQRSTIGLIAEFTIADRAVSVEQSHAPRRSVQPRNSMLELRPTMPQDYPEWSGFARQTEREWVTSGNGPRDKSGEPTHAHLRDWQ